MVVVLVKEFGGMTQDVEVFGGLQGLHQAKKAFQDYVGLDYDNPKTHEIMSFSDKATAKIFECVVHDNSQRCPHCETELLPTVDDEGDSLYCPNEMCLCEDRFKVKVFG